MLGRLHAFLDSAALLVGCVERNVQGSIDDALALARNLGIKCLQIPIGDAFGCFEAQFDEVFAGLAEDTTEENMQSRLRGMILMSLSNKFGHLLLTGNKSELAVGYCTIYGDMEGGFAVISDVPKTMVHDLARWINRAQVAPGTKVTSRAFGVGRRMPIAQRYSS